MSMITLRVSEEEKKVLQKYADFTGVSLSEFIKSRVLESIEDEYDLKMIEEYEKNKKNQDRRHEENPVFPESAGYHVHQRPPFLSLGSKC